MGLGRRASHILVGYHQGVRPLLQLPTCPGLALFWEPVGLGIKMSEETGRQEEVLVMGEPVFITARRHVVGIS